MATSEASGTSSRIRMRSFRITFTQVVGGQRKRFLTLPSDYSPLHRPHHGRLNRPKEGLRYADTKTRRRTRNGRSQNKDSFLMRAFIKDSFLLRVFIEGGTPAFGNGKRVEHTDIACHIEHFSRPASFGGIVAPHGTGQRTILGPASWGLFPRTHCAGKDGTRGELTSPSTLTESTKQSAHPHIE